MHWVRAAASRTFWTTGSSRPIRIAMMAITTSNSINVKAARRFRERMEDCTIVAPKMRVGEQRHRCQKWIVVPAPPNVKGKVTIFSWFLRRTGLDRGNPSAYGLIRTVLRDTEGVTVTEKRLFALACCVLWAGCELPRPFVDQ